MTRRWPRSRTVMSPILSALLLGAPLGAGPARAAAPANDLCEGAEVVPGAGPFPWLSGVHDVLDATTAGDPEAPSCQPNVSRGIWFSFTPEQSGSYDLVLCADGPTATTVEDTVLAVYSGTGGCSGVPGEIAGGCDDDGCGAGDLQSAIRNLDLAAGSTYSIIAWKYGADAPAAGASDVQLRVALNAPPGPAPANDRCDGAEVVPGSGPFPWLTAVTEDVSGATTSGDPPPPSCQPDVSRSVWYSFTPERSGRYTFSLCADAGTGTTVDDTVMAVYAGSGPCAGLSEAAGGCDDDACAAEAGQSVIRALPLSAGVPHAIVVWQYGTAPPAAGDTAVQLLVEEERAPPNDRCEAAIDLRANEPARGSTANAADDYRLPDGSTCFAGIGQIASTAPGGDVVYSFTAPRDGAWSFRVSGFETAENAVLYVAADCPGGPPPAAVAGCLGAANRNSGYPAEEVSCLSLRSGQGVFVYVDGHLAGAGGGFTLEAAPCVVETEPNGAPEAAGPTVCGLAGSIAPAGDVDFFALGDRPAGSRVFALVDGAAANSNDLDLRVTTAADTLEYDDLNDDVPFGSLSPNVAGTPLPGGAAYLRVTHYSATTAAEPYRLYAVVQPPVASAGPEVEPNDAPAQANASPGLYFSGTIDAADDVDLFAVAAAAGDLIVAGLDLDPARDRMPFNGTLAIVDAAGAVLAHVDDPSTTSSVGSGAGSLAAVAPYSPGEAIAWRAPTAATYHVRVAASGSGLGDYLLSIARNCAAGDTADADGDGVADAADCAPSEPTVWAVPGEAAGLIFASGSVEALQWQAPDAPGGTVVRYDLLRAQSADDFAAAACVAADLTTTGATDATPPAAAFFYLVRAENACGGNLGTRSDGTPRAAASCP